jgi:hypothetical protein
MNPWSFYESQPQLVQACVVGAAAWVARRGAKARKEAVGVVTWAAACWAALGVLGFLVYAFGYQLAGLSNKETEPIEAALGWMQVFPVLVGAVAVWREDRTRTLHAG